MSINILNFHDTTWEGNNIFITNFIAAMDTIDLHFHIIATGYNCAEYVKKCFDSIITQSYGNYTATLISDGSGDETNTELLKVKGLDERIKTNIFPENIGAAKRRYDAVKNLQNKESVILFLGLDDELLPNCLEVVKKYYDSGKWMTYGNWIDQYGNGLPESFDLEFEDQTHNERSYRKVLYRSTAPNTFKKFLFDKIPEEDFKINGKWIDTTTESEVMFSCLEMCGKDRIGVIKEPIYLYNKSIRNSTQRRLGQLYKNSIYDQIISRPKKELYENM